MRYKSFERILEFLTARPLIGGLEISDTALRFAMVLPGGQKTVSIRLAPGILEGGRVKDDAAFLAGLRELRVQILGRKARSSLKVNAVVVLSSARVYTQVFDLPYLEGEALEKAVALNIQMTVPAAGTNSGWQIVETGKDRSRISVLAAFLDRNIIQGITENLRSAGFSPVAIEPKALALSRIAREASGADPKANRMLVAADSEGLDILILRGGALHFDYFNSWRELQGDSRELKIETFRELVLRNFVQVSHYYASHWKEPLADILVSATGLKDEIIAVVSGSAKEKVRDLVPLLSPPPIAEWFVALGAALRGRVPRRNDAEVSLLGIDAKEAYRREQVEHFVGFWRILAPSALAMLLVIFAGSAFLLRGVHKSIGREELFRLGPEQAKEIDSLKTQAAEFNSSIDVYSAALSSFSPKAKVLSMVLDAVFRHSVTINRLSLQGKDAPIVLTGTAASETDIREFKKELEATPGVRKVDLPVTEIRKSGDIYTFSISILASV